jgi:hypothetical protein
MSCLPIGVSGICAPWAITLFMPMPLPKAMSNRNTNDKLSPLGWIGVIFSPAAVGALIGGLLTYQPPGTTRIENALYGSLICSAIIAGIIIVCVLGYYLIKALDHESMEPVSNALMAVFSVGNIIVKKAGELIEELGNKADQSDREGKKMEAFIFKAAIILLLLGAFIAFSLLIGSSGDE